jgi:hypothetical protein
MWRLWKLFCWVLLALLFAGAMIFRPLAAPKPGELDPRIRALNPPFTVLSYDYFLDGGSVVLKLKDARGRRAAVTFKVSNVDRNDLRNLSIIFRPEKMYPKAYWGDVESAYNKPVELANANATRLWAAKLVHDYAERTQYNSFVSFYLTGRWRFVGEMIYYGRIKGAVK